MKILSIVLSIFFVVLLVGCSQPSASDEEQLRQGILEKYESAHVELRTINGSKQVKIAFDTEMVKSLDTAQVYEFAMDVAKLAKSSYRGKDVDLYLVVFKDNAADGREFPYGFEPELLD